MAKSLELDIRKPYQRIDHFGASGAWSIDPIGTMWSAENKNRIADLLFSTEKGIGLSAWRFNIGAGGAGEAKEYPEPMKWRGHSDTFKKSADAPYDWSTHEGQRWFLQAAKQRGVKHLIAMAYSPPVWMTKNGKISPDESVGTSNLAEGRFEEFAGFLADVLQHFDENEGIRFDAVSPVNEPSWSWDNSSQEGNRYTNDEIKKLVLALRHELKSRRLQTEIEIAEAAEIAALLDDEDVRSWDPQLLFYKGHDNGVKHGGKYREYIKYFLGDAEFAEIIGHTLCYHSYWADRITETQDRLIDLRQRLRSTLTRRAPKAKLRQSEYCNLNKDGPGRDLGMYMALFTARVIHHDLAVAQVSSWHWWLAVSPHDYKDGLIYTDFAHRGDPETVFPSKTLWALGHFSRFIRPGAVRVGLEGADDPNGLMASAYVHEKEQKLTIVLINYGERKEKLVWKSRAGSIGELTGYITSEREGDDLRRFGVVGLNEAMTIPGKSMITLHGNLIATM